MNIEIDHIDYDLSSIPLCDDTKWFTDVNGYVFVYNIHDDNAPELAAKVQYTIVDINSAIAAGINPEWLLDIRTDTAHYMFSIYNKSGQMFNNRIQRLFDRTIFNTNLLIIDRIEVLPKHRGKDLLTQILDDGIRHFGGKTHLAVLKAFPLQFEVQDIDDEMSAVLSWNKAPELDKFTQDENKAYRKLEKYYRRHGFVRITQCGVMVKPLEPEPYFR